MTIDELILQLKLDKLINEKLAPRPHAISKINTLYLVDFKNLIQDQSIAQLTKYQICFVLKYRMLKPVCEICGKEISDLIRIYDGRTTCSQYCGKQLKINGWKKSHSQINPKTGKNKKQEQSILAAINRKNKINPETNLSRQQEITAKMIHTKRNNKDEFGLDIYQRTAIKTAMTRFGQYLGNENKTDFQLYQYYVNKCTNSQNISKLRDFEKRAAYGASQDPYQLDHKFSIACGFLENIPPYIIGNIVNLEMLPSRANNSKGAKCSISKEQLFTDFFLQQNQQ